MLRLTGTLQNFCTDHQLLLIIYNTLQSYAMQPAAFSWNDWTWLRRCCHCLQKPAIARPGKDHSWLLTKWLIVNGFNKPCFIQHTMQQLVLQSYQLGTVQEQLAFWQKKAKQLALLTRFAAPPLYKNKPAFIQVIHTHINLHIRSLTTSIHSTPPLTSLPLITTGLSVAQLAVFIKLLFDQGIIQHSNQKELLRLAATIFKTSRATAISQESLRNKYYSPDPAAISIVKDYLFGMIKILK
jgi:hypothetical protein